MEVVPDTHKCQFESKTSSNYFSKSENLVYTTLKDLQDDVGSIFNADHVLTEFELISLRSNLAADPDGLICEMHQYLLGKGYRPSRCIVTM